MQLVAFYIYSTIQHNNNTMIAQKADDSTCVIGLTGESAADRLMQAYKRLHKSHRVLSRRDFCEHFDVTDDSFRAKRSGQEGYPVTEEEIKWMEDYKPQIVRTDKATA